MLVPATLAAFVCLAAPEPASTSVPAATDTDELPGDSVEAGDPTADPPQSTNSGVRLDRAYLRVRGHEQGPLVEALVFRVPHLEFEPFEAAVTHPTSGPVAFVDLQPQTDQSDPDSFLFVLTIVVSDGRAFDRQISILREDDEATRLLASNVANLLLAIEAGTVEADRGDVPLPAPVAPACPECECPDPPACPVQPTPPPPETTPEEEPDPPTVEFGSVAALSTVLGLGRPDEADRFAAAGATIGLHTRLARGALFGLELRTAGRRQLEGAGLLRLRIAVGAGYRLRRGAWSLGASLWASIEPWWGLGGEIEPVPLPLFGLAARLNPNLVLPNRRNDRLMVSIGPRIELGASAALTTTGPEIGLVVVEREYEPIGVMRVGGLELSTGLGLTFWLKTKPRR